MRTFGKPAPPKPDMKTVAPSATSASASAALATRLSIGIATQSSLVEPTSLRPPSASRTCSPQSLRLHAREPDHLAPLLGFLGNELAECRRRARDQHTAKIIELCFHGWLGQNRVDLAVELFDDGYGCLPWRTDTVPGTGLEILHELADGRQVRKRLQAFRGCHRKAAHAARPDVLDRDRRGGEIELHMAREQVGHRRRRPAIRNVLNVHTRHHLEQLAR